MRLIDADALIKHECEADRMGAMLVVGKGHILHAPTIAAAPVVRGEWKYTIKKGSCMGYHVNAKCSECGWDWFSADGVGNYSAVFGAFVTNGDSKPEETRKFLLENARANNKLNYCPVCGADMRENNKGEYQMNIAGDLVRAFNDGYTQGKADAVVRGRWVGKTPETRHEYVYPLNYKCSNCGFLAKYDGWRYCPNCSAKKEDE